MIGIVFAVSFNPTWWPVGIVWSIVVGGIVVAKLPFAVVPSPPRPLLLAIGFALLFGLFSGGEPFVAVGSDEVGLGGLLLQLRLFGVTLGLFGLTLLTGWTTRAADLAMAAGWILRPLERIGVPTGEVVAGLSLAVRALPLIADEFATVAAMARSEPAGRNPIDTGLSVLSTTAVAAVRRAGEFGNAIEARGSIAVAPSAEKWNRADAAVLGVGVMLVAAIALV